MDGAVAPIAPPPLPDWVGRRPLDVAEYQRMADAGILRREDHVELIEGELIRMAAIGRPHIGAVMRLHELLFPMLSGRAKLSLQAPVRLGSFSEPEPDVAVLRPRADRYRGGLPPLAADVLLLIEVATTSLRYDLEVKAPLYARHGIAAYWVVDLEAAAVIVHREPQPEGYASVRRAVAGETLDLPGLPDARLAVADILD